MSQSLMQLLYLLPPFFLLSRNVYGDGHGLALLVPVLIMAAGQLAGGLAWLAISGEDAPDLIASAPVTARLVWRAKTEAVLGGIALVFAPFILGLAAVDPMLGLITALGVAIATGSATMIQFWFRAQVKRSLFRRRHVSSRIATFAEALSSITWAGAGGLAVINFWVASVPSLVALAILGGAWMVSPARR
jgi:ABC-2 type transport system permease protein